MRKNQKILLSDIFECIVLIEEYAGGSSKEEFLADIETQDAVLRRLEIIGEAAKKLSDDLKRDHPEIPWKNICGMRDIITHDYFGINLERVWNTVQGDLPDLKEKISSILRSIAS
ncbi:MAG: DUF86 domain-containing protein [Candidatus Paceibacterota bacterium]|jgi:uncharacterized protein with HEPN domain